MFGESGYEVVYELFVNRKRVRLVRKLVGKDVYRLISRMSGCDQPLRNAGDFRLMDPGFKRCCQCQERHRLLRTDVELGRFRQYALKRVRSFCPVLLALRSILWRRWSATAIDGIVSLSTVPLRLVTVIASSCCSRLSWNSLFAWSAVCLPLNGFEAGFTLFHSNSYLSGGVQMIGNLLLGEYIGRIYTEMKQRPLYIISPSIGKLLFRKKILIESGDRMGQPFEFVRSLSSSAMLITPLLVPEMASRLFPSWISSSVALRLTLALLCGYFRLPLFSIQDVNCALVLSKLSLIIFWFWFWVILAIFCDPTSTIHSFQYHTSSLLPIQTSLEAIY